MEAPLQRGPNNTLPPGCVSSKYWKVLESVARPHNEPNEKDDICLSLLYLLVEDGANASITWFASWSWSCIPTTTPSFENFNGRDFKLFNLSKVIGTWIPLYLTEKNLQVNYLTEKDQFTLFERGPTRTYTLTLIERHSACLKHTSSFWEGHPYLSETYLFFLRRTSLPVWKGPLGQCDRDQVPCRCQSGPPLAGTRFCTSDSEATCQPRSCFYC